MSKTIEFTETSQEEKILRDLRRIFTRLDTNGSQFVTDGVFDRLVTNGFFTSQNFAKLSSRLGNEQALNALKKYMQIRTIRPRIEAGMDREGYQAKAIEKALSELTITLDNNTSELRGITDGSAFAQKVLEIRTRPSPEITFSPVEKISKKTSDQVFQDVLKATEDQQRTGNILKSLGIVSSSEDISNLTRNGYIKILEDLATQKGSSIENIIAAFSIYSKNKSVEGLYTSVQPFEKLQRDLGDFITTARKLSNSGENKDPITLAENVLKAKFPSGSAGTSAVRQAAQQTVSDTKAAVTTVISTDHPIETALETSLDFT